MDTNAANAVSTIAANSVSTIAANAVSTIDRITRALSGLKLQAVAPRDDMPCIEIAPEDLHAVCARLRDGAGFETNTFVTAIDRFPKEPRFELNYQFLSVSSNDRVRVITRVASASARVATISDLFPGAAWSERECYDMFGVEFAGLTDRGGPKRLLMPEDYDHFPLRKDFPHQGIEPDRLYREWDQRRHLRHDQQHADV